MGVLFFPSVQGECLCKECSASKEDLEQFCYSPQSGHSGPSCTSVQAHPIRANNSFFSAASPARCVTIEICTGSWLETPTICGVFRSISLCNFPQWRMSNTFSVSFAVAFAQFSLLSPVSF